MATPAPVRSAPSLRPLAEGAGWRVTEVTCRAGPQDRAYQEQHDWACIAAVLDGTFRYRTAGGQALMTPGSLLLGSARTCFECGHEHGRGDRCLAFHFSPNFIADTAGALRGVIGTSFRNVRLPPLDRLLPLLAGARGLARAVEMRRRRFAAVFRQVVGVTPYGYILHCRLGAAARRFRDGQVSVLEVALDVGFGDLSEFTRRFHATFGKPPGLYRRGEQGDSGQWAAGCTVPFRCNRITNANRLNRFTAFPDRHQARNATSSD